MRRRAIITILTILAVLATACGGGNTPSCRISAASSRLPALDGLAILRAEDLDV
ncbi:MAG TPA: hypothetical protein VMS99_10980 [Acidimicrobiia bacterium]|nr:hypothetical protein [Acidimicrobiia bacterium]